MTVKRKAIRLAKDERESLIHLYLEFAIPVDQYEERQENLQELCDKWHEDTGRTNAPGDILHYMRSQRKRGLWVRLGDAAVKRNPRAKFSADEKESLVRIVLENITSLGSGTDNMAYDPEMAGLIAKEFLAVTGRIVPAGDLIAEITAIRKRGLLERVEDVYEGEPDVIGFDDIDEVVG